MSAEWCNNTEPHGEHYEPMPPGYSDEARVCFGITVCSRCGEPLHGRTSLCPCFASPMSEQTDPLAQLIAATDDVLARNPGTDAGDGWSCGMADAIRAAVLADPTIVGMEPVKCLLCGNTPCNGAEFAYAAPGHPRHVPLYRTPEQS